jgi:peptide/nickel transport system substrate-binding protein
MKLNRRTFMVGTAGTLVGASLVGRAVGQQGGLLKTGWGARGPATIDPQKSNQAVDVWAITSIHDKLVNTTPGRYPDSVDGFLPGLATSWEATDESKTWTFELRQGVQFHKGYGEFTSADVVYSFQRAKDSQRIGVRRPMYDHIDEIVADGPYRVIFKLSVPDPLFLFSAHTHPSASIMSKAAVEDKGDEGIEFDPIGTGPYQLETVHENPADGVTIVAFPDHWGDQPATERIQFTYIADATARTLALLAGDVHLIEGVRSPGWVPSLQQRDPNLLFDVNFPGSFFSLQFNLTHKPFDNVLVRQAMFYAINRDDIAAAMSPFGRRTYGLNPPTNVGGFTAETIPEELRYEHNPEKARALLAEAGYPDGFAFDAFTSQREDYSSIMLIVQEQLRNVGITMNLEIRDHTAFHAGQNEGRNTLSQNSQSFPPIPTQPIVIWLSKGAAVIEGGGGGGNYSRYGVAMEGIDDLLQQAFEEPTAEGRLDLVRQMEEKVLRDVPLINVVTNGFLVVRSPKLDLGYEMVSGNWDLRDAVLR